MNSATPSRERLVSEARAFHARGWMAGTSGNLSMRVEDTPTSPVAITASGERFEEGTFGAQGEDPAVALEIYLEVLGQEYAARVGTRNRAKAELLSSRYFTRVNLLNAVGHRYDNKVEAVEVVP